MTIKTWQERFAKGNYSSNHFAMGEHKCMQAEIDELRAAQPCKYNQAAETCTLAPMDCQCAIDAALAQPHGEATLPFDVLVGGSKFRKGVKLETFVNAAQRWHREAYPDIYDLTDEQRAENLQHLLAGLPATHPQASEPAPHNLPERDPSKPAEDQGLFRKFTLQRTDGSDRPGGKHHGCEYFVLDITHDKHAPAALRAYAASCAATHPQLSADLAARWGAQQVAVPQAELASAPDFQETTIALSLLDSVEISQGGKNGPSIQLRAAILRMNAAWNAALLAQQVAVPQGWRLVPMEATEAMVRCMQFRNIETGERCYRAMLAATPQPPQAATPKPCTWTEDADGYYSTECGECFAFNEGTPAQNKAYFCHHCGGKIEVKA